MIINHNVPAINTYRQYGNANKAQSASMEKLSSGLRVNRAGDDAAGLAISEKMRGQIRGLDQASRNAQDGISLIQTAEGALNETHSILQRMRELAVQSSNGTATDTDRNELQKEIEQLVSEIDRISTDTEFNTKKLLNGDAGHLVVNTSNAANLDNLMVTDSNRVSGDYTITIDNKAVALDADFTGAAGITSGDVALGAASGLAAGEYTIEVAGATTSATFTLKNADGAVVGTLANFDSTGADAVIEIGGDDAVTIAQSTYNGNGGTISFTVNITADVTVSGGNASGVTVVGAEADGNSRITVDGFQFEVGADIDDNTRVDTITNNGLDFHIGANQNQTTKLAINRMDTTSLGINAINISTQAGAETAISRVNNAIETVSAERAKLGAIQNRLEHTINNLGTSSENLTASESRIRDVDMAKEMMTQTSSTILSQAAQAMLAQANQAPQGVLQLLR